MSEAFIVRRGGTGAGLNFNIVGGLEQPLEPKENTIWVKTDTKIANYTISNFRPVSPQEGSVWVQTGSSGINTQLVKGKNSIYAILASTSQYVNGYWVVKEAQSYQNGKWQKWVFALYDRGKEYVEDGISVAFNNENATAKKGIDKITLSGVFGSTLSVRYASAYTKEPVDLSPYTKLTVTLDTQPDRSDKGGVKVGVTKVLSNFTNCNSSGYNAIQGTEDKNIGPLRIVYDIEALSGKYYVGVYDSVQVTQIYEIALS